MQHGYAMVRELVKTNPLPLLKLKDPKLISYANSLLPYSTGIEVECSSLVDNFNDDNYITKYELESKARIEIPYIMSVRFDVDEQRFRIPHGIKGLVALYHVGVFLKKYCGLNPMSGVHYHIDCTDIGREYWGAYSEPQFHYHAQKQEDWVLKSLKSWNYTGKFNKWKMAIDCRTAVRIDSYKRTIEYRIGEMTFDYALFYKRISHCQHITKAIKKSFYEYRPKKELPPKVIGKINLRTRRTGVTYTTTTNSTIFTTTNANLPF